MSKERDFKKNNSSTQLLANDIAVLGILAESPRPLTGKEVNMVIEMAHYRDWVNIQFSTAYICLKRMEKYGYVKGEYITENKRRNKKFKITKEGFEILQKEIKNRLSEPRKDVNEIDLAIKNIIHLKQSEAILALDNYIKKLQKNFEYYEEIINGLRNAKPGDVVKHIPISDFNYNKITIVVALFERPYRELLTRKKWLEEMIEQIKEGKILCADFDRE